jgi:hypothetical protein
LLLAGAVLEFMSSRSNISTEIVVQAPISDIENRWRFAVPFFKFQFLAAH